MNFSEDWAAFGFQMQVTSVKCGSFHRAEYGKFETYFYQVVQRKSYEAPFVTYQLQYIWDLVIWRSGHVTTCKKETLKVCYKVTELPVYFFFLNSNCRYHYTWSGLIWILLSVRYCSGKLHFFSDWWRDNFRKRQENMDTPAMYSMYLKDVTPWTKCELELVANQVLATTV